MTSAHVDKWKDASCRYPLIFFTMTDPTSRNMSSLLSCTSRTKCWFGLFVVLLAAFEDAAALGFHNKRTIIRPKTNSVAPILLPRSSSSVPINLPVRGGSTDLDDDEDDDTEEEEIGDEEEEEEEQADEDEEEENNPLESVVPSEPITVTVKTNLGSKLVDTSHEFLVSPTKDIAAVKKSVARQMAGRPPAEVQRLMLEGKELQDDVMVYELVGNEEEDDDDDEDDENSLVLTLDIVPPVDPKFVATLDMETVMKDMTTGELLEAYATNAAAMYHNSQLLVKERQQQDEEDDDLEEETSTPTSTSVLLRQEAHLLRQQLLHGVDESVVEQLDEPPQAKKLEYLERRGQRKRVPGGRGAKQNIKRSIQRNLNINWMNTIRNILLFLFFGFFGGRDPLSRNLLFLGAPLCVFLQARPVKICLKVGFYMLKNPPSLLLSLLPAPEQAILSFNPQQSYAALYGEQDVALPEAEEASPLDGEEPQEEEEDSQDEEEYSDGDDETEGSDGEYDY